MDQWSRNQRPSQVSPTPQPQERNPIAAIARIIIVRGTPRGGRGGTAAGDGIIGTNSTSICDCVVCAGLARATAGTLLLMIPDRGAGVGTSQAGGARLA